MKEPEEHVTVNELEIRRAKTVLLHAETEPRSGGVISNEEQKIDGGDKAEDKEDGSVERGWGS